MLSEFSYSFLSAPWLLNCSLSALWPRKMKIDCSRQVWAARTNIDQRFLGSCRSQKESCQKRSVSRMIFVCVTARGLDAKRQFSAGVHAKLVADFLPSLLGPRAKSWPGLVTQALSRLKTLSRNPCRTWWQQNDEGRESKHTYEGWYKSNFNQYFYAAKICIIKSLKKGFLVTVITQSGVRVSVPGPVSSLKFYD